MTLRTADFETFSHQATLWIEDYDPGVRQLMGLATRQWADRFDGEPSVLPRLPNLPEELPRFTVASVNRSWKLQIAPRRVNVFWERTTIEAQAPIDFSLAAIETIEPYIQLSEEMRVSRLAYVVKRYALDEHPGRTLTQYFCRDELLAGPLKRPQDFQLHAHKAYVPDGSVEVNSWVRWRTVIFTLGGQEQPAITVEQDLNTLAEAAHEANFSPEEVRAFFSTMPVETDRILRLYLGESEERN